MREKIIYISDDGTEFETPKETQMREHLLPNLLLVWGIAVQDKGHVSDYLALHPKPNVNPFCDNCSDLSPTEREQISPKQLHTCVRYHKQVYHNGRHPLIYKCKECNANT